MYLTVCRLCGPDSIPSRGGVFLGIFPWLITLPTGSEPGWQKIVRFPFNGTTEPVDMEGLHPTKDRQWIKNQMVWFGFVCRSRFPLAPDCQILLSQPPSLATVLIIIRCRSALAWFAQCRH